MSHMKKIVYLVLLLLVSCSTPKNMIYFVDAENIAGQQITQNYINKIQKDDLLSITVGSKTPELAIPFNPVTNVNMATPKTLAETEGYLVNSEGYITFPILGKIKVLGLTYSELASLIEKLIIEGGYINDPIVTVKLLNYKISVLGEVKMPGVKDINTERVTIFEALSMAGDLTIYGQRENVSIIREENGQRTVAYVDLTNSDIFNSPYYYMRPNDVIYIVPNKKQQRQSVNNPYLVNSILSGTSLLVNLANFLTR